LRAVWPARARVLPAQVPGRGEVFGSRRAHPPDRARRRKRQGLLSRQGRRNAEEGEGIAERTGAPAIHPIYVSILDPFSSRFCGNVLAMTDYKKTLNLP